MQRYRFLFLFVILFIAQVTYSQHVFRGKVFDAETQEPIVGATIANGKTGKVLTVTDTEGAFEIPNYVEGSLKISSIGYKTLSEFHDFSIAGFSCSEKRHYEAAKRAKSSKKSLHSLIKHSYWFLSQLPHGEIEIGVGIRFIFEGEMPPFG